jgi:hypothetical protein
MAGLFRIAGYLFLLVAAGVLAYYTYFYGLFFVRHPDGAISLLPLIFGGIISIALGAIGRVLLAIGRGRRVMPNNSFNSNPRR